MSAPAVTPTPAPPRSRRGRALAVLLFDMAAPIACFYLLRAAGLGSFAALLLSAILPALSTLVQVLRERHLDSLAVFMVGITVISALVSLVGGSPRFLLAKDGFLTAVAGFWMLATTRANPPVVALFARPLLEGRVGPPGTPWEVLWERLPGFRQVWRRAGVIWGVATILDAGVRFGVAATLPVDTVPALNGMQWAVLFVLLQVVTNVYYFRAGLYDPHSAIYAPLAAEPRAARAAAED